MESAKWKLETMFSMLMNELNCEMVKTNAENKDTKEIQMACLVQQLDNDEVEELDQYRSYNKQATESMMPFILPTDQRLLLIEWLIDQCEPGIFQNEEYTAQYDKSQALILAWKQFGIQNNSRYFLENSIKGTNGVTEAIEFLWEVVDFTRQLIWFENFQNPHIQMENNNNLINFISQNQEKIFTTNVRLFTPGFPRLDDNSHELEARLKQTQIELNQYVKQSKEELIALQNEFDQSLAENMEQWDIDKLEESLKATRDQMLSFKNECDAGLRNKLNKIKETSLSGIEPIIDNVYKHRNKLGKVSDNVGKILSTLTEIQI